MGIRKIILNTLLLILVSGFIFGIGNISATAAEKENLQKWYDVLKPAAEFAGYKTDISAYLIEDYIIIALKAFLSLLGIIFLVYVFYGGWLRLTAGGDAEEIKKANEVITQAIYGLAIILGAYIITSFIVAKLITAAL